MKKKTSPKLGLYIHIPFCKSKCLYCDFYSLPNNETQMDRYTAALQKHLREIAPHAAQHSIDTIYFGGGTPSYLGAKRLCSLLKTIQKHYHIEKNAEITLFCNLSIFSVFINILLPLRLFCIRVLRKLIPHRIFFYIFFSINNTHPLLIPPSSILLHGFI